MKEKEFKFLLEKIPKAEYRAVSPGRVNLLGEHVDYNNGIVLPAAIDRHVMIAAKKRGDRIVNLHAVDMGAETAFSLDDLDQRIDCHGDSFPDWALYPAGVAWALQNAGYPLNGIDAVYCSDLPVGAGLSSSAAVESSFAVLWQKMGDFPMDRMTMAKLCQYAENQYVGVNCGIMDQFACTHGVARHVLFLDVRSLTWQPLPIPQNTCLVIADSGIRRELANSVYNQRRAECEAALKGLLAFFPDAKSLRDIPPDLFNQHADALPELPRKRARHVIEEIERVKQASICLVQDDTEGFGKIMVAGHSSLRDLFEVSIPQLDELVEIALSLPGCFGARLTGAGFGGCTINLVEKSKADEFISALTDRYTDSSGAVIETYVCQASRGAYAELV